MVHEKSDAVSEVKHRHDNSVANCQCACVNKLIICITTRKEKAPIYKQQQNTANLGLQTYEKNQRTFCIIPHGR